MNKQIKNTKPLTRDAYDAPINSLNARVFITLKTLRTPAEKIIHESEEHQFYFIVEFLSNLAPIYCVFTFFLNLLLRFQGLQDVPEIDDLLEVRRWDL